LWQGHQPSATTFNAKKNTAVVFKYDLASRRMFDNESGDSLIFDRILPEDGIHVCRLVHGDKVIPFRATLTWEGVKPPRAVWLVEYLGKNLLGVLTVNLDPVERQDVILKINDALLSYSARNGTEFEGALVRVKGE
jgi:hypothetical protein